jgi:MFS family permease
MSIVARSGIRSVQDLSEQPVDEKDPAYGWLMVFVAFMLSAFSFGALGSISVFLKPLAAEFGWGRGDISLAYTATAFSSALFGILWGVIADKFGTRWFGIVGSLAMTVALFLLSSQNSLAEFYAFYFLFGAVGHAMVTSPLFANVGFWFKYSPGLALGITASGGAIGQGVVPYLAGLAITAYGWQAAYQLMALAFLVVTLPVACFVRESPRRQQVRLTTIVETREFPLSEIEVITWIGIAVIFCCNCMAVPIVHLVPLLTDNGMTMEAATRVFLVLMLAGAAGRIVGGQLGDVIGPLPTYMIMSLGQTVFVFWFPYMDAGWGLYLLAMCFGFTYSGVMSSILVCTRVMVSARFAARAMSVTAFFGWGGMGLGGYVGGMLFDRYGDYVSSFSFASVMGVVNLLILLMFSMRIKRARQANNMLLAGAIPAVS